MRKKATGFASVVHPDRISRLTQSAARGELVAVIGTGVSVGLTDNKIPALTWKGLILDGFGHGVAKGKINENQAKSWKAQLDSSDIDDLLAAAEFVGRKLDAPEGNLYARWLENVFKAVEPTNDKMKKAVEALRDAAIPICTLNYDPLLERVTGLPTINLSEMARVTQWMRQETSGVLHLHGSWDAPQTCILGIRDYETTLRNEVRDLIQRSLGSFKRLLFIGCGDTFGDPNFSALIAWLKRHVGVAAPEHYALVRNDEVVDREVDPAWQGFVAPIGYGAKHDDLSMFLTKSLAPLVRTTQKKKSAPPKASDATSRHAAVLRDYRAFLLKDCGQMTIEGLRADMDTAQRRFDLEQLFVPISMSPTPPDIPAGDLEREQKLRDWHEKNKDPRPFGEVFAKKKRLALLALPGGGKTLLLKRLAVAYADPPRRQASVDGLPNLELTPVLIRCREWREHIHRPILTLLNSISDITGQASLSGLSEALVPLFKKGRVLLLVDGLDEIHDDALRTTFVDHLESFLDDHKLTRLVITSREAGFSLVAPTLARFCERWRLAPLDSNAIAALCELWHRLMIGESPEAKAEAERVANTLLNNESLRRLAENPLLLTMLLVVKHGAGRLPPDRVSLYGRAVEVLLDTWNIKGHDPLSLKEAVPQLACVAFELMRAGKQTATESELLKLLEEARERVPQIRRYAQDSPQAFLKRVELRSSLLVEAGRQKAGAATVPFYQFRHLTFQEYLAAVAAVEGHYMDYDKTDTVLTPLKAHLTAEEWKEVIPMSAVLARKQAEPLMNALVQDGALLPKTLPMEYRKIPAPVSRLVQCLVEEAEAAPETLTSALQLIVVFARGCNSPDDWQALCRGPYGDELLHQALLRYSSGKRIAIEWLLNTCMRFAVLRKPYDYWVQPEGSVELQRMLHSEKVEDIGRAVLTFCGLLHHSVRETSADPPVLEEFIFCDEPYIRDPAIWAWTLARQSTERPLAPSSRILDRLMCLWLEDLRESQYEGIASFALSNQFDLQRSAWKPTLSDAQRELVRHPSNNSYDSAAACVVAFHERTVWPERELARRLTAMAEQSAEFETQIEHALNELEVDKTFLKSLPRPKHKARTLGGG